MGALLGGVLAASLVGSLHCAGMCGPLAAFCSSGRDHGGASLAAYHLARLVGYLGLGLAAGAVGAALDLGGEAVGLGRVAAVLAGAVMILSGLGTFAGPRLARWRAARSDRVRGPGPVTRAVTRATARARDLPATGRSLAIGGLSALLPCGWLYAFAAAAAGTGSPTRGALVMAAFWLGTVPILLGLGLGVAGLLAGLRRRAPRLMPGVVSVCLVGLGLFTLTGRWSVPSFAGTLGPDAGQRAVAGQLADEELPCCTGESVPGDVGLAPLAEPCGCEHEGPCVQGVTCGCPGCGKEVEPGIGSAAPASPAKAAGDLATPGAPGSADL